MEFLSVFASIASINNLFGVAGIGILVWLICVHMPQRDQLYIQRLDEIANRFMSQLEQHDEGFRELIEKLSDDERRSHELIIAKLERHDKHAMASNQKIDSMHRKVVERE